MTTIQQTDPTLSIPSSKRNFTAANKIRPITKRVIKHVTPLRIFFILFFSIFMLLKPRALRLPAQDRSAVCRFPSCKNTFPFILSRSLASLFGRVCRIESSVTRSCSGIFRSRNVTEPFRSQKQRSPVIKVRAVTNLIRIFVAPVPFAEPLIAAAFRWIRITALLALSPVFHCKTSC